eukprot:2424474-Pyramimonas_sp.AAC.1
MKTSGASLESRESPGRAVVSGSIPPPRLAPPSASTSWAPLGGPCRSPQELLRSSAKCSWRSPVHRAASTAMSNGKCH